MRYRKFTFENSCAAKSRKYSHDHDNYCKKLENDICLSIRDDLRHKSQGQRIYDVCECYRHVDAAFDHCTVPPELSPADNHNDTHSHTYTHTHTHTSHDNTPRSYMDIYGVWHAMPCDHA